MTAYLRHDMWATTYARAGEYGSTSPSQLIRLRARFEFGRAVVMGAASTAIYLIAILILLVPHVLSSMNSRYIEIAAFRKVRKLFYLSIGRFKAAIATSLIASISIFKLDFALSARQYLHKELDRQWDAYKTNLSNRLHQRVIEIKVRRLESSAPDEIFRPKGSKGQAYYSILADDVEKRVKKYCAAFAIGKGPDDGKYERFEKALEEIDLYVNSGCQELSELPVTYQDVATWRFNEAKKLQRRALTFFEEQVGREVNYQKAKHPRKFDTKSYSKKVDAYRRQVKEKLEKHVKDVQAKQGDLLTNWKNVEKQKGLQTQLQNRVAALDKREANWRWWIQACPFLPQAMLDFFASRADAAAAQRNQIQGQLNQVNQHRAAWVNHIANRIFLDLNSTYFKLEHIHNYLVKERGGVFKTLESLAKPSIATRVWRQVAPLFSLLPSCQVRLENWFDPDVA